MVFAAMWRVVLGQTMLHQSVQRSWLVEQKSVRVLFALGVSGHYWLVMLNMVRFVRDDKCEVVSATLIEGQKFFITKCRVATRATDLKF